MRDGRKNTTNGKSWLHFCLSTSTCCIFCWKIFKWSHGSTPFFACQVLYFEFRVAITRPSLRLGL